MKLSDIPSVKAGFVKDFNETCRQFKELADSIDKIAAEAPPQDVERIITAGASPETAVKTEENSMNKEFTLRNVVDFLEANGFRVREAREIEKDVTTYPFEASQEPPKREVRAIRVEIAPKKQPAVADIFELPEPEARR